MRTAPVSRRANDPPEFSVSRKKVPIRGFRMGFRRRELHKKQMEDAEATPGAAISRAYDDEPDWEAGWCRAPPKHAGCDDV